MCGVAVVDSAGVAAGVLVPFLILSVALDMEAMHGVAGLPSEFASMRV